MRYEDAGPDVAVLDLLARVDELAVAAVMAIEAGDDAGLKAVLEQRGHMVEAAVEAWRAASPMATPGMLARVVAATQLSVQIGDRGRAVATRVRDEVSAELSQLEARQSASQEYQQVSARSAINVVL